MSKINSQILADYEKECAVDARYVEAEMAKHKRKELQVVAINLENEKKRNAHLKEKVEVEEAYLSEFNEFQTKWEKKLEKFEEKVESSRLEMMDNQKDQLEIALQKIEEKYSMMFKEDNNTVLNLKKVEKALAKQKRYIEAQKTREEWRKEQENLAIAQREEIDKKKNDLINEYELKNKKEVDQFVTKINEMRIDVENERQKELNRLVQKYDRIKNQLKTIQDSESKRVKNMKNYKVRDVNETHMNNTSSFINQNNGKFLASKKKVLMKKIKRLDQTKEL